MSGDALPLKTALAPVLAPSQLQAAPLAPRSAGAAATGERRVDSATLLGPRGEIFIDHQQQVYRLRRTAQGKLILTK